MPDEAAATVETEFALHSAGDHSITELADLFSRSYVDYFFPVNMDLEMLSWIIGSQSIDLAASKVVESGGALVGFIFIASRGLSRRVAAMGVLPEYRRKGIGNELLRKAIDEARKQGYRQMLLEVIDGNAGAMALYKNLGFEATRVLVGYDRPQLEPNGQTEGTLIEIDPREVARAIVHEGEPDLPWQRTGTSMFNVRPPSRAFSLEGDAFAVVSRITDHSAYIDAFLVPRTKRRNGYGTKLMNALFHHLPNRAWTISATVPEDLAPDFFIANGFQLGLIRQYEMELNLSATQA
jgi:ribosomal protein S18 acetylase RimI-like enzyme